jgi:indole-3-glycerol phosphate synthase
MSDVLQRILADKRAQIDADKQARSFGTIDAAARQSAVPRGFVATLRRAIATGRYGLIAEIKRASPSRGLIRADFDPAHLAISYAAGGASCLSVLTDGPYFQGSPADLAAARAAVTLPILRKDFMIDPWQIAEARAMGADCILLIMAALDDGEAAELEAAARDYDLDALVEVHDRAELDRALLLETPLIGVNNRNLKTLSIDLATTEELAAAVPRDRVLVSESGLAVPDDLARMARAGARCFLIGEALMRQPDVTIATRRLIGEPA